MYLRSAAIACVVALFASNTTPHLGADATEPESLDVKLSGTVTVKKDEPAAATSIPATRGRMINELRVLIVGKQDKGVAVDECVNVSLFFGNRRIAVASNVRVKPQKVSYLSFALQDEALQIPEWLASQASIRIAKEYPDVEDAHRYGWKNGWSIKQVEVQVEGVSAARVAAPLLSVSIPDLTDSQRRKIESALETSRAPGRIQLEGTRYFGQVPGRSSVFASLASRQPAAAAADPPAFESLPGQPAPQPEASPADALTFESLPGEQAPPPEVVALTPTTCCQEAGAEKRNCPVDALLGHLTCSEFLELPVPQLVQEWHFHNVVD